MLIGFLKLKKCICDRSCLKTERFCLGESLLEVYFIKQSVIVAHAYNPSPQEAETGGLGVPGQG